MSALLVAGGAQDPNVHAIIEAAERRGVQVVSLLVGDGHNPSLTWDLSNGDLRVDGKRLAVTGVFTRRDVFHGREAGGDYRAAAWSMALQGWIATRPDVRVLNRDYIGRYTNKLHALCMARAAGLEIPSTVVTNDVDQLKHWRRTGEMIAKPVPGGGYCQSLDELVADMDFRDGVAAAPAIVQRRLPGPDVRIFLVNGRCLAFRVSSDALDYRTAPKNCRIEAMARVPGEAADGLKQLAKSMSLTWCAADFKAHPESGKLTFLEINSDPMFSVFDRASQGAVTSELVPFLAG